MAKGNRYQIIGTEQTLKGGAVDSPSSNPRSGQFQLMGDACKMGRRPIPSPSSNPPEGQRTIIGDQAKMNRTPVHGWGNAANLTMSPGSYTQDKNAAQMSRKKGR